MPTWSGILVTSVGGLRLLGKWRVYLWNRQYTRRPGGPGWQEADDPFRYGWRYVRRTQPDGTTVIDEIPLTRDPALSRRGRFRRARTMAYARFTYCYSALTAWFAAQSNVVVLGDCRVDWGVPGIRPLGPDIVVLYRVRTGSARRRFTWRTKVAPPCWWWRLPRPVRGITIWGSSELSITRRECRSTSLWTVAQGKIQYGCLATSAVPPAGSRSLQMPRAAQIWLP